MSAFKLKPDPTFQAEVKIPVAGGEPASITFTFKHRMRDELDTFVKEEAPTLKDEALIQAVAQGWDLKDKWTEANLALLCQSRIGAPAAIYDAYLTELLKAREKN